MSGKIPESSGDFLFPPLVLYLKQRTAEFNRIVDQRKRDLTGISEYIGRCLSTSAQARLTFICTHNSRRSQLSQIWALVAAKYYGIGGIATFSGGTEVTAFNPRAVASLQRSGLRISVDDPSQRNPHYSVFFSPKSKPQICFSKTYSQPPNPMSDYCAIMTCSDADIACPLVTGCELRVSLPYEDPKVADDTQLETQIYDQRSAQICREMLYLMSCV